MPKHLLGQYLIPGKVLGKQQITKVVIEVELKNLHCPRSHRSGFEDSN